MRQTAIISALDKALEHRIIHLFEVLCSGDVDDGAVTRFMAGLSKAIDAHEAVTQSLPDD